MRIHELITEARRNPESNQTLTPIGQIKYLHNKSDSTISGNVTNLFISMTRLDKLGINPRSKYDTPIGIYSYATDYVVSTVKNNLTDLPFVGNAPFVSVFKATDPNSILVLNDMTTSDVDFYLSKINSIQEFAAHVPRDTSEARIQTPGGIFWYITFSIANSIAGRTYRSPPIVWNSLFRKLGIDGCVDTGAGIIHQHEKAQAVFFSNSSVSIISRIKNKLIDTREQLEKLMNIAIQLGANNRKPEIEKVLARSPEFAFIYARDIVGGAWPAGEPAIATDPKYSVLYAVKVTGLPFPAGEVIISDYPSHSYNYARYALNGGRFPAGEAAIARNAEISYNYATLIGMRFLVGESKIASDPRFAVQYDQMFGTNLSQQ